MLSLLNSVETITKTPNIIGSKTLLSKIKSNVPLFFAVSSFSGVSLYLLYKNQIFAKKAIDPYGSKFGTDKKKRKRSLVNMIFFRKLLILAKIAIPGVKSKEMRLLIVYTLFLIARTYLSIKISDVNGLVVKSIVSVNRPEFFENIRKLAFYIVPASVVNSMLKFLLSKLAFSFRSQLLNYFNDLYFQSKVSYKVVNIDSRVPNPDQIMTSTITEWSQNLAELYSNISKPILDIILFSKKLTELLGFQGPLAAFVYYSFSAVVFRLASPMFGKLTSTAVKLEGNFKRLHGRLINYAEEIALYGGNEKESENLSEAFSQIENHSCYTIQKEYFNALMHGFISKYGSFLTAYGVLGLPVFNSKSISVESMKDQDRSEIVGDYIRNSNLYINLSVAIGKIIVSYNNVQKLAGYTTLLAEFRQVLLDLLDDKYVRVCMRDESDKNETNKGKNIVLKEFKNGSIDSKSNILKFENMSIVTPNGDVLVEDLSLEIRQNMNTLITGPNGCGKSSLFRILSGLWPVAKGAVSKSEDSKLFYIPQKPYLLKGSLRDQIIYPQSMEEFKKVSNDSYIMDLLDLVKIKYICKQESGGLDGCKDWQEVLSGGEKQQIALARLIYHRPVYAILDECTSAVSFDLEKLIYTHCKAIGITLITVSHRKSLWKYHEYVLSFDGRGNWEFRPMQSEDLI